MGDFGDIVGDFGGIWCNGVFISSREVHDFCTLLGFGADAICPYLVYETMNALRRQNKLEPPLEDHEIFSNYVVACANGIAKVMAKMGISTLHSYKVCHTDHARLIISLPTVLQQECSWRRICTCHDLFTFVHGTVSFIQSGLMAL